MDSAMEFTLGGAVGVLCFLLFRVTEGLQFWVNKRMKSFIHSHNCVNSIIVSKIGFNK